MASQWVRRDSGSGEVGARAILYQGAPDPYFRNSFRSKQRDADFGAVGRAVFCWIHPRGDCQLGS